MALSAGNKERQEEYLDVRRLSYRNLSTREAATESQQPIMIAGGEPSVRGALCLNPKDEAQLLDVLQLGVPVGEGHQQWEDLVVVPRFGGRALRYGMIRFNSKFSRTQGFSNPNQT